MDGWMDGWMASPVPELPFLPAPHIGFSPQGLRGGKKGEFRDWSNGWLGGWMDGWMGDG